MKKKLLLFILLTGISFNVHSQDQKLSAYTNTKTKPKKVYKIGGMSLAVWETKKEGKYGSYTQKNFKVVKRYKKDDKWKETNYYNLEELLKLKAVIDKAILEESVTIVQNN